MILSKLLLLLLLILLLQVLDMRPHIIRILSLVLLGMPHITPTCRSPGGGGGGGVYLESYTGEKLGAPNDPTGEGRLIGVFVEFRA